MHPFLVLLGQRTVLFDGAIGPSFPESWNLEQPDRIRNLHLAYVEAGSDVIQTNTLGGNRTRLEMAGLGGRLAEINRRAVALAREAARTGGTAAGLTGRFVAASVGPTGQKVERNDGAAVQGMEGIFAEQIEALAEAGVDLFTIETMADPLEALCALRAARRRAPGLPVLVSLAFRRTRSGFTTRSGDPLLDAVAALEQEGADVIGAGCALGTHGMGSLAPRLRAATKRPLLIRPNAGQPQSATDFARGVARILDAGVNAVGGCCGTTPDTIRALAALLARRLKAGS